MGRISSWCGHRVIYFLKYSSYWPLRDISCCRAVSKVSYSITFGSPGVNALVSVVVLLLEQFYQWQLYRQRTPRLTDIILFGCFRKTTFNFKNWSFWVFIPCMLWNRDNKDCINGCINPSKVSALVKITAEVSSSYLSISTRVMMS